MNDVTGYRMHNSTIGNYYDRLSSTSSRFSYDETASPQVKVSPVPRLFVPDFDLQGKICDGNCGYMAS